MWRWALAVALLGPASGWADEKPKAEAPSVWPPAADEPAKKPTSLKKKRTKDKPPDEASEEPLPRFSDDGEPSPPPPKPEPPEDPCQAPLDECREDCTIEHTNDDTTKADGRQGLVTCIKRCGKAHRACEERRALGLEEKVRDPAKP